LWAFERAWQQVIARNPILRTAFAWHGLDEPLQVVYRAVPISLDQHDWCGLTSAEQEERMAEYRRSERQAKRVDFNHTPLMPLTLCRMTDDAYQLFWTHHNLLLDGWSTALVLKELKTFYEAFCEGREPQLERNLRFRDYIEWLQRQDLTEAEAFWRQELQ